MDAVVGRPILAVERVQRAPPEGAAADPGSSGALAAQLAAHIPQSKPELQPNPELRLCEPGIRPVGDTGPHRA
eukprot:13672991-Alexandrium_andersonii.AAC.1